MGLHINKEDLLRERIESMAETITDLRQQVKLKNDAIAELYDIIKVKDQLLETRTKLNVKD
jgi:hypothetical protein